MSLSRKSLLQWIAGTIFAGILTLSPVQAQQLTHTCHFNRGPRSGKTISFGGAQPVAVGSVCTDGLASFGVAVPDNLHPALTHTCGFDQGPRSGTSQAYPVTIPVGLSCWDGVSSSGMGIPDGSTLTPSTPQPPSPSTPASEPTEIPSPAQGSAPAEPPSTTPASTAETEAMVQQGLADLDNGKNDHIPFDKAKAAADLFHQAAEAGNVKGMCYYGVMLRQGEGVQWNEKEAMEWLQRGAAARDRGCEFSVGIGLMNGLGGLTQDYKQAAFWFRDATKQGSPAAAWFLALLYYRGWGVPEDYETAKFLATQVVQGNLLDPLSQENDLEADGPTDRARFKAQAQDLIDKINHDRELEIGAGVALGALLVYLASSSDSTSSQPAASSGTISPSDNGSAASRQKRIEDRQRYLDNQQWQKYWADQQRQYQAARAKNQAR
jgi:Sel1 repeat